MGKCIGMISLGCAKNQVNAEQMMYLLQEAGYTLLGGVEGADVVIINTCGFIDSAKTEAIDNILAMASLKDAGVIGKRRRKSCAVAWQRATALRGFGKCSTKSGSPRSFGRKLWQTCRNRMRRSTAF